MLEIAEVVAVLTARNCGLSATRFARRLAGLAGALQALTPYSLSTLSGSPTFSASLTFAAAAIKVGRMSSTSSATR